MPHTDYEDEHSIRLQKALQIISGPKRSWQDSRYGGLGANSSQLSAWPLCDVLNLLESGVVK